MTNQPTPLLGAKTIAWQLSRRDFLERSTKPQTLVMPIVIAHGFFLLVTHPIPYTVPLGERSQRAAQRLELCCKMCQWPTTDAYSGWRSCPGRAVPRPGATGIRPRSAARARRRVSANSMDDGLGALPGSQCLERQFTIPTGIDNAKPVSCEAPVADRSHGGSRPAPRRRVPGSRGRPRAHSGGLVPLPERIRRRHCARWRPEGSSRAPSSPTGATRKSRTCSPGSTGR
jgi:hypothetical protein